jgi:hypothetical protein
LRNGVIVIGLLVAGATGCGGGDSGSSTPVGRFEQQGFEITFRYPQGFRAADDLIFGTRAGAADTARAGVGIDRQNVILVSRYDLRRSVTFSNVDGVKAEVDSVIGRLAGKQVEGRAVRFGGLPGYEYAVRLGSPQGGFSRLVVLFDRRVEYFFNCQSTPESRAELDAACDQALTTLQPL